MRTAAPATAGLATALAFSAMAAGAAALAAASTNPWPLTVALLIAPVIEETVFRAGLHDGLLHGGTTPWRANMLTALAFSAAHMLLLGASAQTALVFVPALLIGAAYNRWRRLRICIVLHMAMNALWIAVQGMS
jgi:membrane protease YdiL (CAAX protease family)